MDDPTISDNSSSGESDNHFGYDYPLNSQWNIEENQRSEEEQIFEEDQDENEDEDENEVFRNEVRYEVSWNLIKDERWFFSGGLIFQAEENERIGQLERDLLAVCNGLKLLSVQSTTGSSGNRSIMLTQETLLNLQDVVSIMKQVRKH